MMRKLVNPILVVAVVMLAAACAQQRTETAPPAEMPPASEPPPTAMAVELTPAKVTELAQLSVQMERNPAMSSELLMQHGLTLEQLQEAMGRVAADTTMNAMFMQAKEAAMAVPPADAAPPAEGSGH